MPSSIDRTTASTSRAVARAGGGALGRALRTLAAFGLATATMIAAEGSALAQFRPPPPRPMMNDGPPEELASIEITDHAGEALPRDIQLTRYDGTSVTTGDYIGDRPLLILLAYYECPMLCSLVLNGLLNGMKGLEWTAGREYRVLVVSFDPRDGVRSAREKRDAYVGAYQRDVGDGWDFAVGDEAEVRRLANALGFAYEWHDESKQYAHAAGAFAVNREGVIARTLYGIEFPADALKFALEQAPGAPLPGRDLPLALQRAVLWCYQYDPKTHKYVLATTRLMQAGGAATVLGLGGFVLWMFRRERRTRRDSSTPDRTGPNPPGGVSDPDPNDASAPPSVPGAGTTTPTA